jgi:hypothetical protein
MKPYPVKGFLIVRAGMGSGETLNCQTITLQTCHGDSKVLFVFSTGLALKNESHAGCDSARLRQLPRYVENSPPTAFLPRQPAAHYHHHDLVVVDEAASVLMHLNSAVMHYTSLVLATAKFMPLASLFSSAMCDSTFVRRRPRRAAGRAVLDLEPVPQTEPQGDHRHQRSGHLWRQRAQHDVRRAVQLMTLLRGRQEVVVTSSKWFTVAASGDRGVMPGVSVLVYNGDTRSDVERGRHVDPEFHRHLRSTITVGVV